jgi:hypothetical protein
MNENTHPRGELVRELTDIHASLKVLSAGQEEICRRIDVDIKTRLDKVNGSIATLYARTEQNKEALLNHVIDCPQREKIEKIGARFGILEQRISKLHRAFGEQAAVANAVEAQSSKWMAKLLFPLIRIAATGLVLILLYHTRSKLSGDKAAQPTNILNAAVQLPVTALKA